MTCHAAAAPLSRIAEGRKVKPGQASTDFCHACHAGSSHTSFYHLSGSFPVETDHPPRAVSETHGAGILSVCDLGESFLRQRFRESAGADGKELALLVTEFSDRAVGRVVEEIVEAVILIADE